MTLTPALALNRFGYGPRAADAAPADPARALADQLHRYDPRPPQLRDAADSAAMGVQVVALYDSIRFAGPEKQAAMDARKAATAIERAAYQDAVRRRAALAIATPDPFAERLVHFWANHFAVSIDKQTVLGLAGPMEFEAIRPHITGRFTDMLLAVERHPGMQLYLDQAGSIGPDSVIGLKAAARPNAKRRVGLNENLGREILELHTLGVGSGYTQADVTELARALTGWSVGGFVRQPVGLPAAPGSFVFQPDWHQPGTRTILGKTYADTGEGQAKQVLTDLAVHPATARHVSVKLARHFVADVPPPALVDRMTEAYLRTGGDLPTLYRLLIAAPAFTPKFKTPWDWLISALRGVELKAPEALVPPMLNQLGQQVWKPGSPAGWDDTAASWAAPDALFRRVEIAGRIAGQANYQGPPAGLAERLLPGALSPGTAQAIARADSPAEGLALLLSSPEFLRR